MLVFGALLCANVGRAETRTLTLRQALDTWGEVTFNYASTDTSDYAVTTSVA